METLGFARAGEGAVRVIVLHDWMGDHRNYDPTLPYLDEAAFTWAMADLRGYGLSRDRAGRYDLLEAAGDVLALADGLGWERFSLVGHSMSTMVAQQVAASAPERVSAMALLTPVPPTGLRAPAEAVAFLERMAMDETVRAETFAKQGGGRHAPAWTAFKLRRWREAARPEASRAYVAMFAATAVEGRARGDLPVLAVVGEHDAEHFREPAVRAWAEAAYQGLADVVTCANAGHYPMQETPVALASALDRFLRAQG
jgi:3-oxoadipate enol-lactonase